MKLKFLLFILTIIYHFPKTLTEATETTDQIVELGSDLSAILKKNSLDKDIKEKKKDWLVFFYIAADNSLSASAIDEIANIRNSDGNKVHILISHHTKRNGEKISERLVVLDKKLYLDGKILPKDSGSEKTFQEELEWALGFNGKKIMVVIWNHGAGILNKNQPETLKGICKDESTGNWLSDLDLKSSFDIINIKLGKKPNIITLDACLMSSIEIAYALKDSANFLIASQDNLPGNAFNYKNLISILEKDSPAPLSYAKTFVKTYADNFDYYSDRISLFALDLTKIESLAQNIFSTSKELILLLGKNKEIKELINKSLSKAIKFNNPDYIDLGDFISYLMMHIPYAETIDDVDKNKIIDLLYKLLKSASQVPIAWVVSIWYKNVKGLSIYFPSYQTYHESYDNTVWTYNDDAWSKLIKICLKNI